MSTNLIAVFDSAQQALTARQRLEAANVPTESIRIEADDSTRSSVEREDRRGFFEKLFSLGDDDTNPAHYEEAVRRGNAILTVSIHDEGRVDEITELLEDCGAADVDERVEQWRSEGYVSPEVSPRVTSMGSDGDRMRFDTDDALGTDAALGVDAGDRIGDAVGVRAVRSGATSADSGESLKSIEEELKIGKRTVERGRVRVHRTVSERPVQEEVTLHEEKALIDRRTVDRPATPEEVAAAFQDRDIEIRETTEEAVVSKSARVVEEVTVGKQASDRTEVVHDTVRSTRIEVDNQGARSGAGAAVGRYYSGPERRFNTQLGNYNGVERRTSADSLA